MRLSLPLCGAPGHNLIRIYKFQWALRRNMPVHDEGDKKVLEKAGATIHDPEEIFTKPFETPRKEDYFPPPPSPPEPKEEMHYFGTNYKTLPQFTLPLMQNFCSTVTSDSLPESSKKNVRECLEPEIELFRDSILSSHLLDAYQKKLAITVDMESKYPVRRPKREYGIPIDRRNQLLSMGLAECFDNTSQNRLDLLCRPHLINTNVSCALRYKGQLVHIDLPCPLWIGSSTPLSMPVSPTDCDLFIPPKLDAKTMRKVLRKQITVDTGTHLQQPLPDVHPMSDLAGAKIRDNYPEFSTKYVHSFPALYPHTIHIHHNERLLKLTHEELTGLTLLNLYTHAVSYAASAGVQIDTKGRLSRPVVIQAVHSHLNLVQPAVFQLHTLGPHCQLLNESPRVPAPEDGRTVRNVLFYEPFSNLYDECDYNEKARPAVTGLNSSLLSLLRGLHEN